MTLRGSSISLRAIEPKDIDLLYKWENDASLWLVSGTVAPFSKHVLQQYLENAHLDIYSARQLRLVIDIHDAGNLTSVGLIDLFDFDPQHKRAGVGILLADDIHRGKGFASEALKILVEYCFSTLHLHQLYCNITTDNVTSLKLFEQNGFVIAGNKKEWIFDGTVWLDEYMLQLINAK